MVKHTVNSDHLHVVIRGIVDNNYKHCDAIDIKVRTCDGLSAYCGACSLYCRCGDDLETLRTLIEDTVKIVFGRPVDLDVFLRQPRKQ